MSNQATSASIFFQPLPEHDNLNVAYLLAKIAEKIEVSHECWEWTGTTNKGGYGQIEMGGRKQMIHRLVFALCVDEIPGKLLVLHRCDNPPCCRPGHLFLGDEGANIRDCVAKGRHPELKLTDEQALEIRQRAATEDRGILRRMAREYGVSLSTINRIVRHDSRFHLADDRWKSAEWQAIIRGWQERLPTMLREFRASRSMEQKDLASLLKVSKSYLCRIESGQRIARPSVVLSALALLGIDMEGAA